MNNATFDQPYMFWLFYYVVIPFTVEDIISEVEYPMKLKHARTHKVFPIPFQEKVTVPMSTCCIYLYIDSRPRHPPPPPSYWRIEIRH